jgi:hypothetical protein
MALPTSNARRLQGRPISPTAPTDGQALAWSAASGLWLPQTIAGGGGGDTITSPGGTLTIGGTSSATTADVANNGVSFAKLATNLLVRTTLAITAAQIKALIATPIQLVAAPGANKIIVPVWTLCWYKRGATSYVNADASASIFLFWGTQNVGELMAKSAMVAGWGCRNFISGIAATDTLLASPAFEDLPGLLDLSNTAVNVQNAGGTEYTVGDGTLSIEFIYRIVDLTGL